MALSHLYRAQLAAIETEVELSKSSMLEIKTKARD
jgi:hypothetical protein